MTFAEYSKKLSEFQDKYNKGVVEHDDCVDMISAIQLVDSTTVGLPLTLITKSNRDSVTEGVVVNVLSAAKATLDYLTPGCGIKDNNVKLILLTVSDIINGKNSSVGDLVNYASACKLAPCILSGTIEDIATRVVGEMHIASVYSSDMKFAFMEIVGRQ